MFTKPAMSGFDGKIYLFSFVLFSHILMLLNNFKKIYWFARSWMDVRTSTFVRSWFSRVSYIVELMHTKQKLVWKCITIISFYNKFNLDERFRTLGSVLLKTLKIVPRVLGLTGENAIVSPSQNSMHVHRKKGHEEKTLFWCHSCHCKHVSLWWLHTRKKFLTETALSAARRASDKCIMIGQLRLAVEALTVRIHFMNYILYIPLKQNA